MIYLRDVQLLDGTRTDMEIESSEEWIIDAWKYTALPALIDPHVHFRTPGLEHKENWETGALAAIRGGITTVFDMPNTIPSCITHERVKEKKDVIDSQLKKTDIPLRYHVFLGADQKHIDQISIAKSDVIGIKIFMGSSTGDMVMTDPISLERVFEAAAKSNLMVAVHAEDEAILQERKAAFAGECHPRAHSQIRSRESAITATARAIELARKHRTKLYLLHIGTKEEVDLIRQAKKAGLTIYAEVTPHHLFLTEKDYENLGTKVQMNPPIRAQEDLAALWAALNDGTIDSIGSDHAPHTLEEKNLPYGKSPSGIPGIETTLPLMLNAVSEGKITLPRLVELMRTRIETIFNLPANDDLVLVDLDKVKKVDERRLATKCGWSPYHGWTLRGWPAYTLCKGKVYACE